MTDQIDALITSLGLTIESTFVPFSQSRHAKGEQVWKSLNWRVTLKRNAREVMTTEYSQGVGHCPSNRKKAPAGCRISQSMWEHNATEYEIERGRIAAMTGYNGEILGTKSIPGPKAADVLSSLVLDSSVLDSATFEDWAADLGYDPDSRKAETIYRECLETALKLRAAIGDAGISALQEAFQDY
jgi:hypothetical protein